MQEIFQEGILVLGTHNISLAHTNQVITKIADLYIKVFKEIKAAIDAENLIQQLKVEPITPFFRVR